MKNKLDRFFLLVKNFGFLYALKESIKWVYGKISGRNYLFNQQSNLKDLSYKEQISISLNPFAKQWFYLNEKKSFFSRKKLAIKRVLIIADLNIAQCNIYRVDGLITYLNSYGIRAEKSFFLDLERIRKYLDSSCAVIFYRVPLRDELLDIIYECKRANIKMVYDIDDPVFSFTTYSDYENLKYVNTNSSKYILEGAPKYFAMMSFCDFLITSTPQLSILAKKYFPDKQVFTRRNYINESRIISSSDLDKKHEEVKLISITSGSIGHEDDFKMIQPALENVLKKNEKIKLLLLGKFKKSIFSDFINDRIQEHIPFQDYENYIKSLSETDLSLIPIKKSDFNECKSIVRLLDCCNAGVPAITSDIGDYNATHETTPCFEISKDDQWEQKITNLIDNKELRDYYRERSREFLENISSGRNTYIAPEKFTEKIVL